jgi:hypothetical protein
MNSMPLSQAIDLGITELKRQGVIFRPNISGLLADFSISPSGGVIALVPENVQSGNNQGYDLVRISAPEVPNLDITVGDIWECAKEHYGLTAAVAITGAGGVPINKMSLGHRVHSGSSKYTNLTSHLGHKFFPRATLPHGSAAAKVAKSMFGTIRVFGIVGRGIPFVAIGLAVFDAISIGMCAYEASHGRK